MGYGRAFGSVLPRFKDCGLKKIGEDLEMDWCIVGQRVWGTHRPRVGSEWKLLIFNSVTFCCSWTRLELKNIFSLFCWERLLVEKSLGDSYILCVIGPWSPGVCGDQPPVLPCRCLYPAAFPASQLFPLFSLFAFCPVGTSWCPEWRNLLIVHGQSCGQQRPLEPAWQWRLLTRNLLVVPSSPPERAHLRTHLNFFLGLSLDSNLTQVSSENILIFQVPIAVICICLIYMNEQVSWGFLFFSPV